MSYIHKQQHRTSCGPVAIMNAIKWLGGSLPYRKYVGLFEEFYWVKKVGKKGGMSGQYLASALKLFGIKYKWKYYPTTWDIEAALNRGNAVILVYKWYNEGSESGHFVFIDHHTDTRFRAYNARKDGTSIEHKIDLMEWFYRSKRSGEHRPQMWEIFR